MASAFFMDERRFFVFPKILSSSSIGAGALGMDKMNCEKGSEVKKWLGKGARAKRARKGLNNS